MINPCINRLSAMALVMTCLTTSVVSHAAETTTRLGDLILTHDATRWLATPGADGAIVLQTPAGSGSGRAPVLVTRQPATDRAACAPEASRLLPHPLYGNPVASETAASGAVAWLRYSVHMGCRNRTPKGEVFCAFHGDHIYTVTVRQSSCRGGPSDFVNQEWLADLLNAAAFVSGDGPGK